MTVLSSDIQDAVVAMRERTSVAALKKPLPPMPVQAERTPPMTAVELYAPGGAWPRQLRNAMLTRPELDSPGYQADKTADSLAAQQAWAQGLRDMPGEVPDPADAVAALLAYPPFSQGSEAVSLTPPPAATILAFLALFILGTLAFFMLWVAVPQSNHDFIIYILGAISGALTVGGAQKLADKITTSNGPDATIQPDAKEDAK